MDSNHCSGNKYTDAINELLNSGKLTPREAAERLANAVENELKKPPADIRESFIVACEDLIYILSNKDEYVSQAGTSRRKLEGMLAQKENRGSLTKRLVAATGIAAALLAGIILVDGILSREWLAGTSTPDEQQFEVAGNVVDPGLVEKGKAANMDGIFEVTTSYFDEAVSVLGYTPLVPAWVPEGWEVKEYYAFAEDGFSRFSMELISGTISETLKYELRQYEDAETAQFAFEQNEHGDMVFVNKREVYLTTNVERSAAIWLDGNTTYSLYGPIDEDYLIHMITSI